MCSKLFGTLAQCLPACENDLSIFLTMKMYGLVEPVVFLRGPLVDPKFNTFMFDGVKCVTTWSVVARCVVTWCVVTSCVTMSCFATFRVAKWRVATLLRTTHGRDVMRELTHLNRARNCTLARTHVWTYRLCTATTGNAPHGALCSPYPMRVNNMNTPRHNPCITFQCARAS